MEQQSGTEFARGSGWANGNGKTSGLVVGLKGGDPDACRQFVERHHERMFSLAYRILGSREDARDCVQDVCISIVQKIDGFKGGSSLSTWVHRIVVNKAISCLRSRKHFAEPDVETHLPQYDADGYLIWPTGRDVRPLDELMESEQIAREVRAAIDALPEDSRNVVLLRDVLGYDTRESAEILEITPSAAKVRLHRARSILKSVLSPIILGSDQ